MNMTMGSMNRQWIRMSSMNMTMENDTVVQ